jgi:hypothetical protein
MLDIMLPALVIQLLTSSFVIASSLVQPPPHLISASIVISLIALGLSALPLLSAPVVFHQFGIPMASIRLLHSSFIACKAPLCPFQPFALLQSLPLLPPAPTSARSNSVRS